MYRNLLKRLVVRIHHPECQIAHKTSRHCSRRRIRKTVKIRTIRRSIQRCCRRAIRLEQLEHRCIDEFTLAQEMRPSGHPISRTHVKMHRNQADASDAEKREEHVC
jgi:hypothetical protein